MTTCLHTHSWLNWVDEDDDEDEVDLKEKPEDTKINQQYYIKIRPEAPGVWAKDLINVIKDLIIAIIGHYGLGKVQVRQAWGPVLQEYLWNFI